MLRKYKVTIREKITEEKRNIRDRFSQWLNRFLPLAALFMMVMEE